MQSGVWGSTAACDLSTRGLQSFALKKMGLGSGWEIRNLLRNLISKIVASAKESGTRLERIQL